MDSPLNALPVGTGRNLNRKIAVAEALQLIGGFSDPEWLCRIAPQFKKFREDLTVSNTPWFHGAYGTRISMFDQLHVAVKRLEETPDTRQAVVTLWDPEVDTEDGHLDYPCTVALNFRRDRRMNREHDTLNMQVLMRSNDVWLGLPYDLFQFTQLQLTLCNVLGLQPGLYTHTAWSMHIYSDNLAASYDIRENIAPSEERTRDVRGLGAFGHTLAQVGVRARRIARGDILPVDLTPSERWYLDVLDGEYSKTSVA